MFEVLHVHNPSVGDQNVNLAKLVDSLLDHLLDTSNVARVGLDSKCSVTADGFDHLVGRSRIGGVIDRNAGAIFCKTESGGFPNAFGTTSDESDFACKTTSSHFG